MKNMNANTMAAQLGQLMIQLEQNSDSIVPQQFVQYFRTALPRFNSRNENGVWEQQDADEAYTEILSALQQDNSFVTDDDEKRSVIGDLFEGEFTVKSVCMESEEEPELNVTEKFVKLQCFIDINTRHINDGIKKGFEENVEKRSDKLGRNAIWKKTKTMSKLPKYIPVQLVRFFWKQKTQKNAKILRKVIFPEKMDVYDFCSDDLKAAIEKYRKLKLEKEDREREKRQAVAIEAKEEDKDKDKDKESGDKPKENEEENADGNGAEKKEETKEDEDGDKMDVDDNAEMELVSGYYELCGIVTHKGRSANSGHYIGYSRDSARGKWLKFDDEDVTEIKPDDIKQLYGGGDFQMAFLCIFRRVECEKV